MGPTVNQAAQSLNAVLDSPLTITRGLFKLPLHLQNGKAGNRIDRVAVSTKELLDG